MCKVISIINQKGGVAKTTTVYAISDCLAKKGKRVLMIDFDPQSSLTVLAGFEEIDQMTHTITDLMSHAMAKRESLEFDYDIKELRNGVSFIPANKELAAIEVSLTNVMSREYVLSDVLEQLKSAYDYIIIDCSPSLSLLTINALAASDSIIIPVTAEYLSAKGLEMLLETVLRIKKRINPQLEIEGILFTKFKARNRLTKAVVKMTTDAYGGVIPIFEPTIAHSTKVAQTAMYHKSIVEYAPKHKSAQAYIQVVEEILANEK